MVRLFSGWQQSFCIVTLFIVLPLLKACSLFPQRSSEKTEVVYMYSLLGADAGVGTVEVSETPWGLLFIPNLKNLPAGIHGFHIHEHPDCGVQGEKSTPGMAAGGHFDPGHADTHQGPYGHGHLGDLPVLVVNSDGKATTPVLAPRLYSLGQIHGRSLMIHAGGDNYSDNPKLGGGGARIACGIIH